MANRIREETTRDVQSGSRPDQSKPILIRYSSSGEVRTPAGCTTPRQGAMAGSFLFNSAVDEIMRRTVEQCPVYVILARSARPVVDLHYADDVVIFASSSAGLQHVVILASKLPAACGMELRPDKCKQMWVSSRPSTGIRVDGKPTEPVDEFCYLGYTLKKMATTREKDIQQRCAKANSAFNS